MTEYDFFKKHILDIPRGAFISDLSVVRAAIRLAEIDFDIQQVTQATEQAQKDKEYIEFLKLQGL